MLATRVHVFSDRGIVRAGVEAILTGRPNISVAGSHRVTEMSHLSGEDHGSVAVVDELSLDRAPDGVESRLRSVTRTCQVLVLVGPAATRLLRYVRAGVRALVADGSLTSDLVAAVTALSRGQAYLSVELLNALVESLRTGEVTDDVRDRLGLLTKRERTVLDLVLGGLSNTEITRVLQITQSTAKFHISNIFRKLRVRSRSQLHAYLSGPAAWPGR